MYKRKHYQEVQSVNNEVEVVNGNRPVVLEEKHLLSSLPSSYFCHLTSPQSTIDVRTEKMN